MEVYYFLIISLNGYDKLHTSNHKAHIQIRLHSLEFPFEVMCIKLLDWTCSTIAHDFQDDLSLAAQSHLLKEFSVLE